MTAVRFRDGGRPGGRAPPRRRQIFQPWRGGRNGTVAVRADGLRPAASDFSTLEGRPQRDGGRPGGRAPPRRRQIFNLGGASAGGVRFFNLGGAAAREGRPQSGDYAKRRLRKAATTSAVDRYRGGGLAPPAVDCTVIGVAGGTAGSGAPTSVSVDSAAGIGTIAEHRGSTQCSSPSIGRER